MAKFFNRYWPLILIIVFSVVLRLIKLQQLFYFTYDESVPAFVGRRLILWHHLPLIGGVTPFGVHISPYFYWFLAVLLYIGKLDPVIWGVAGALIAAVTTFAIYLVGSSFQDKKLGITAAIFWAFSYLANIYDRHLWALYWGPLVSLVVIYCLLKLIKGKENFIFLLALALAWSLSADPSNLVFLVITIIIFITYKLPIGKKTFIAIGIFLISFSPLVLFDLRHNFENISPFFKFWQQGKNNPGFVESKFIDNSLLFPRAFTRPAYTFGDNQISKQYSYCQDYVTEKYHAIPPLLVLISALGLFGFIYWSFKNKNKESWRIVGILIPLYFIGIQIYGTIFKADIFEHYITGLFAVFLLISAKAVSALPKRIWLLVIALFVIVNLLKLFAAQNGLGLTYKKQAIEFTMNTVGDNPFSLESLSTCWRYSGYRYLFAAYAKEPVKSYVDPELGYLYGTTPIATRHPQTVVVFVVHDFAQEQNSFYQKYALYKSHEIKNSLFGNIEVIIMNNASGWFDNQK